MPAVAVVNPKGGVGKTTLATHVPVHRADRDRATCEPLVAWLERPR
jgi:cellulose biosynthesis protein BcsQ